MNIKDIRALLTRLDHSDNGRDIRDMHVEMKGSWDGNLKFVLTVVFVNGDVVTLPVIYSYASIVVVARWMLYSELSDAYKQHAWLSLMEFLDEKIIWWTLNNDESKENIELTEF